MVRPFPGWKARRRTAPSSLLGGLNILVVGASQFAHEDYLIRDRHPDPAVVGIPDSLAGCRQPELPADWLRHQVYELVAAIMADPVACAWLGTIWGSEGGPLGKR